MHWPRIFLTWPASQDASVVDVVVVNVVEVVVAGMQYSSILMKPSSHRHTGNPSIRAAFSLHVQVSPGRGSSWTPMHKMQTPAEFKAISSEHTSSVVDVLVVVVVDVVDVVVVAVDIDVVVVCRTHSPSSSMYPGLHTHRGAYDRIVAFGPHVQSSVDSGVSIAPKQRIQTPILFLTIPFSHSPSSVVVVIVVTVVVDVEVVLVVVRVVVEVDDDDDVDVVSGTQSPLSFSTKPIDSQS